MRNLRALVRSIYTRPDASHARLAAETGCHPQTVHRYRRLLLDEGRDRWHWAKLQVLDEKGLDRELNRRQDQGHRARRSPVVAPVSPFSGSLRRAWEAYRLTSPNPCCYAHFVREVRAQQKLADTMLQQAGVPVVPDADANNAAAAADAQEVLA